MKYNSFTLEGSKRQKVWTLIRELGGKKISEDWKEVFVEVPIWSAGGVKVRLTQVLEPVYTIVFENIIAN